jgi:hypothetical protein
MEDLYTEEGENLTKHIEDSNIDYLIGQEIIGSLHALKDWSSFGDYLIKEFGIDWYIEQLEKSEQLDDFEKKFVGLVKEKLNNGT